MSRKASQVRAGLGRNEAKLIITWLSQASKVKLRLVSASQVKAELGDI